MWRILRHVRNNARSYTPENKPKKTPDSMQHLLPQTGFRFPSQRIRKKHSAANRRIPSTNLNYKFKSCNNPTQVSATASEILLLVTADSRVTLDPKAKSPIRELSFACQDPTKIKAHRMQPTCIPPAPLRRNHILRHHPHYFGIYQVLHSLNRSIQSKYGKVDREILWLVSCSYSDGTKM